MSSARRTIAVALHDIEPATFERCALIRDWLDDHGVDHVTLLVIPARDLHPLAERSPEMVSWLIERERGGDAIAQHGFQHLRSRRAGGRYQALSGFSAYDEAEFLGLDAHETRRAVSAGWRVLKLAGIEPRGFVAPAYAYTPALRRTLGEHFHWWAALLSLHRSQPALHRSQPSLHPSQPSLHPSQRSLHPSQPSLHPSQPSLHPSQPSLHPSQRSRASLSGQSAATIAVDSRRCAHERNFEEDRRRDRLGPPLGLTSSGRLRRALSPALLRAGALLSGRTLRLDLHPSDLDHPSHMLALEWVLNHSAAGRDAVTYDELAFAA